MKTNKVLYIKDLFFNIEDFNGDYKKIFEDFLYYVLSTESIQSGEKTKEDESFEMRLFELLKDDSNKCRCDIGIIDTTELLKHISKN